MTGCDECGFRYDSVALVDIGSTMRAEARAFAAALAGPEIRTRPEPEIWSPLEYGCHVRDMLQVQTARVARALAENTPSFQPMLRDERPARLRYNEQDPVVVKEQVVDAADALADVFDGLTEQHLARTVMYNWPVEAIRSLGWLGRHTIHELVHHRGDLRALTTTSPDRP